MAKKPVQPYTDNTRASIDEISDLLQIYLTGLYPGAQVTDFQFLFSGFESDIYTFKLHTSEDGLRLLILRIYPGDGVTPKILREATGLRLLHRAGFPVPAILCCETATTFLGKPFSIMERLEGRVLWPLLSQAAPSQAFHLLDQFSSLLARLHRLEWCPFTDQVARYEASPAALLDDTFVKFRQLYEKFDVLGFTAVLDWLDARKTSINVQPVVAHLDYHANNVFLREDGSMAVIDWSQVTVADYRADLTWTLMIMGDYGQPYWREHILQAYRLYSGKEVENLDYFNVITDTKSLASTVISLKTNPSALGLNPARAETLEEETPNIQRLSRRIRDITGIVIPEVEALLKA